MRRSRRERGESQFGCLVGAVLLLLGVFIAYKLIPVKIKAAEVRQTVADESKAAGTHNDDQIKKAILRKAEDQRLPITEKNIDIDRREHDIAITVEYTVPVQFPGYVYQYHFRHHEENPIF